MISTSEFSYIREKIFNLLNFKFQGKISTEHHDGVRVDYDGTDAVLGCKDKSGLGRALLLLALNSPKGAFHIEQKVNFDTLGVMLDCSRNAVMRIGAVKKYIECMAALGFNRLMLYTEDTYELEKYPRFGYMRGRYTASELQQIDDYAHSFGIEVIPCIQTLGHMSQYLQCNEAEPIKDTNECMLVGADATYEFIEEIFKTCRKIFRSNIIHLNIDETWDLGLGKYLDKNGYKNKIDLIFEHIARVYKLCKEYNYKPIIAGDMLFRLGAGGYYKKDAKLPEEYKKHIPEDMTIVYWDYYHTDKELYRNLIDCHLDFGRPLMFYGSIWTWEGFIENTSFTYDTSVPAMEACIEKGVKDIIISTWGDDGQETSLFRSIGSLPIFSEMCYTGKKCEISQLDEISKILCGISFTDKLEVSKIHAGFNMDKRFSARMFYTDIFYDLVNQDYDYKTVMQSFNHVFEYSLSKDNDYFTYCKHFAKCVMKKCEILNTLRSAYSENDFAQLKLIRDKKIPEVITAYEEFLDIFTVEWNAFNKPFGLEVIINRIGGVIYRMKYAEKVLESYINGNIDRIEELEEKKLPNENPYTQVYAKTVTPSAII